MLIESLHFMLINFHSELILNIHKWGSAKAFRRLSNMNCSQRRGSLVIVNKLLHSLMLKVLILASCYRGMPINEHLPSEKQCSKKDELACLFTVLRQNRLFVSSVWCMFEAAFHWWFIWQIELPVCACESAIEGLEPLIPRGSSEMVVIAQAWIETVWVWIWNMLSCFVGFHWLRPFCVCICTCNVANNFHLLTSDQARSPA